MPILALNWGRRIFGEIEAPGSRDCPVTQGTLSPTGDSVPRNPPQGTPSPVIPLAYSIKVCVRAYGASALQFLYIYAVGFMNLNAVGGGASGGLCPPQN